MWLVGCISHDELSPLPSHPWRDSDAIGHCPALLNGHPCVGVHVLSEFLFMGGIGGGAGIGHDRVRDILKNEERIEKSDAGFLASLFSIIVLIY